MLERLNTFDTELFLLLNGQHNAFLDPIMYWASEKWFWIPFYLFLFLLIIAAYKKRSLLIFLSIGALITLSDQISSSILKPWTKRLRPSHQPALMDLIYLSEAGPGGMYGFVSGHATNSFALFVFLSLTLNKKFKWLKILLCFWAILVSYSRIYVGVHYPGDVLGGAILGTTLGYGIAILYKYISNYEYQSAFNSITIKRKIGF